MDENLILYEEEISRIDKVLSRLIKGAEAKCALLVDKDGHMVTWRGHTKRIDLDTISALVAGSFAATREMAKLLGEEEFTALFHQGKSDNIQLALVGDRALLTAIFDETTTVGMVRLYSAEAAKRLATIFKKKESEVSTDPSKVPGAAPDPGFAKSAGAALDGIFGK